MGEESEKRRKRGVGHGLGHGVAIQWPTLWPTGGQIFKNINTTLVKVE